MTAVRVVRQCDGPIIAPSLHPSIGVNIQGPSLIRVPDWVEDRLGAYYLYFADHKGSYIRLAYADALVGPWRVHAPGSLQLAQSRFLTEAPVPSVKELAAFEDRYRRAAISHDVLSEITTPHIASPDVHVDDVGDGWIVGARSWAGGWIGIQVTRVATSANGIEFAARPEILGKSYFRVFQHDGMTYALAMPGQLYRSRDGLSGFEAGPMLFNPNMRHAAVLRRGTELLVFWTQVGDAPERILLSRIDLTGNWMQWQDGPTVEVLRPERSWEGADAPLTPSVRSTAYGQVNQLRDPAVYEEDGHVYSCFTLSPAKAVSRSPKSCSTRRLSRMS